MTTVTHPQPGFYENVVTDLGYDPDSAKHLPQSHADFVAEHGLTDWISETLGKFDARLGKFDPPAPEKDYGLVSSSPAPRPPRAKKKATGKAIPQQRQP